jgi:hypothetical protein
MFLPHCDRQLMAMQWLVSDARPNDSLFFHCEFFFHQVGLRVEL